MKFLIFLILINPLILFGSEFKLMWQGATLYADKNEASVIITTKKSSALLSKRISPTNFNDHHLYFKLKVSNILTLKGLEIRLLEKENSKDYLSYTFPLFSDYEFNNLQNDTWLNYSLSYANLKGSKKLLKKINFIQFFIFNKSDQITFKVKEITAKKKTIPGHLSITFDDGHKTNLIAAKILSEKNLKATAYIMPKHLTDKDRMNIREVTLLKNRYNWHIDSHASIPFTYLTSSTLKSLLDDTTEFLSSMELKDDEFHVAYPLGKTNSQTLDLVKKYFKTARIAGGGVETIPPADQYKLRTFNVTNKTTLTELKQQIELTKNHGAWLILMFHELSNDPRRDTEFSIKNFRELSQIIIDSKIKVTTIDEFYNAYLK